MPRIPSLGRTSHLQGIAYSWLIIHSHASMLQIKELSFVQLIHFVSVSNFNLVGHGEDHRSFNYMLKFALYEH